MEIKSTFTNRSGQLLDVVYRDIESELDLGNRNVTGVHVYCFYEDKLLVVYTLSKGYWTPVGGGVEVGESLLDAVRREVKEESNMEVLEHCFIGCQDIFESKGVISQTRSVCIVKPYGMFVKDVDGDITEIRLIDPKDYKEYFDWKEIGDHIMKRALELKAQMETVVDFKN